MSEATGEEIWLEGEFGMIVGRILDVHRDRPFLVIKGESYGSEEHERWTVRIPGDWVRMDRP